MRCLLVVLSATLAAGCPSGDDTTDDSSDAGIDGGGDGGSGAGITLTWESRPVIPGMLDDDLVIERARFGLMTVRLISDAATPSVDRTELAWSAGTAPVPDVIDDAPAGVYASLQGMIAAPAATYAFEIAGTYEGTRYVIRDSAALPFVVPFGSGLVLDPGGMLSIRVRVRVEDMLDDIDFTLLPNENGTLVLGPGNAQLPMVRDALAESITVSDE